MPIPGRSRSKSDVNVLLGLAGLMAVGVPCVLGQAGAATGAASAGDAPYVPTMTFDVASVRENKNIDMQAGFIMGGRFVSNTTYRATNWPIENLISTAFGVMNYQIVGAPNWPYPTFFMIEAKRDSEADAKLAALTRKQREAEQEYMLQVLLQERFKLKAHWETREGDVYQLVVAKGGPKLGAPGSMPLSELEKKMYGEQAAPALNQTGCDEHGCTYIGHACSMGRLVGNLDAVFGGPVIDKIGLTGKYDFQLKYKGARDRDRPADDMDPTPPMDRALEEQLGLKVEAAKGPVKVLVIDHVEKPSAN
jgi:uncharacterized protein (TIGR03435 family)